MWPSRSRRLAAAVLNLLLWPLLSQLCGCITFDEVMGPQESPPEQTVMPVMDEPPPPVLALLDPGYDYGAVELGTRATYEIGIVVTGTLRGDIFPRLEGDAELSVLSSTCVGAGGACSVIVQFEPQTLGSKNAVLIAAAAGAAETSIALTGRGRDYARVMLNRAGDGSGSVSHDQGGTCAALSCDLDLARLSADDAVLLTATPEVGTLATVSWSGCDETTASTCRVTLSGARAVGVVFTLESYLLTVQAEEALTNSGASVASMDVRLNGTGCFPICTATVKHGKQVSMSISGLGEREYFIGWDSGPCHGTRAVPCVGPITQATTVTARYSGMNYAFFTATGSAPGTYAGLDPMGQGDGLRGADKRCADVAAAGDFYIQDRAWRAYLAAPGVDAWSRLFNAEKGFQPRGWMTVDGRLFADRLLDPNPSMPSDPTGRDPHTFAAALSDEDGSSYNWSDATAFTAVTGANVTGVATGDGQCAGWSSTTGSTAGADVRDGTGAVLGGKTIGCDDTKARLYCFSIDFNAPSAPPPLAPEARLAFVSKTSFTPGSGLSGADLVCQQDAVDIGLCSSTAACPFKALLAEGAASAASRFDLTAGPWYRVDGVRLAETAQDFMDDLLEAALDRGADGKNAGDVAVWTGAPDANNTGTVGSTCNGFSCSPALCSSTSGTRGLPGNIDDSSDHHHFNHDTALCNTAARLYCLED